MSTWLCIPSARPVAEANVALGKWRERGYKIALWRDDQYAPQNEAYAIDCHAIPTELCCDIMIVSPKYPGYAVAVNTLIAHVMEKDPNMQFCVASGDDTFPEPSKHADEIAFECTQHAFKLHGKQCGGCQIDSNLIATFLVMQPTGDRWQDTPQSRAMFGEHRGALIDRVAGSPFIGREFARRMYGGKGPYWPGYTHQFVDQELQEVAIKMGVFWQRRDLTHYHAHALRTEGIEIGPRKPLPAFLIEANSKAHWEKYSALFKEREVAGFPGHEPSL